MRTLQSRGRGNRFLKHLPWKYLAFSSLIGLVDQCSKFVLISWLEEAKKPVYVTDFFNLVMVWNHGISFGMFQTGGTGRWILVLITFGIMLAIVWWLFRLERKFAIYGVTLVLGGALGNVADRISHRAAVADIFDIHFMGYHWPAFNIADSAISLGIAILLLDSFLEWKQERKSKMLSGK